MFMHVAVYKCRPLTFMLSVGDRVDGSSEETDEVPWQQVQLRLTTEDWN